MRKFLSIFLETALAKRNLVGQYEHELFGLDLKILFVNVEKQVRDRTGVAQHI